MALADFRPPEAHSRRRRPRLVGAALVALVHALLIGFLLSSLPQSFHVLPTQHEIFFLFHPPPKLQTPPRLPVAIPGAQTTAPYFRFTAPSAHATAVPPAVRGLGLSLFGCAPENLANLSPADRAHCGDALSSASLRADFPGAPHELSLDPGRWRQAIRAGNMPVRVPCTYIEQIMVNGITGETKATPMVDPLCVLGRLAGAMP